VDAFDLNIPASRSTASENLAAASARNGAPVCPAGATHTLEFAIDRWESEPPGMTRRFLDRRETRMFELRGANQLRSAERFGWLSIAALWLGLGARYSTAIHTDHVNVSGVDDLLTIALVDLNPTIRAVRGAGLDASDPTDPYGVIFADLAAATRTSHAVHVGDRRVGSGMVATALLERLGASS